jgi:hypothetical protein
LGVSVQHPRRVLARANAYQQDRRRRYTYPSLKKTATKLGVDDWLTPFTPALKA